jgi:hypothetical protein
MIIVEFYALTIPYGRIAYEVPESTAPHIKAVDGLRTYKIRKRVRCISVSKFLQIHIHTKAGDP